MKLEMTGQVVNAGENGEGGFYVEIDTAQRRGSIVFDLAANEKYEFGEGQKVKVIVEAE